MTTHTEGLLVDTGVVPDLWRDKAARDAHVTRRLQQGAGMAEVVEELATARARALFADHVQSSVRRGRRMARRLDVAAAKPQLSMDGGAHGVLDVILDATKAVAALLVVRDEDGQRIACVASRDSFTNGSFQAHGLTLDLGSVFGSDAHTVDSFVSMASGALRDDGVGPLLVTRLPADDSRRTAIVLCRPRGQPDFDATDVTTAESLGERMSWHLCRGRLVLEVERAGNVLRNEQSFRDRFVAILAHDLRGPLMVARVGADLLAEKPLSPARTHEVITRIDGALDRADRMLRDLLDANRLRAGGRLVILAAPCDLGALAEAIAEELRSLHGARFAVHAEHVEGFWSSDEIHRALWNLCTNAVKYGDGNAVVTIDVREIAGTVRLSVHNFGGAIAAEDQRRLFEPFSRTEAAARSTGWGLGLAIVRGCAEAHGGVASVRSDANDGTTFTMELPLDARPFARESERSLAH